MFIPETPPRCSSPGGGDDDDEDEQPKEDQPDSTIQANNIADYQGREPDNDNEIEPYEIVVSIFMLTKNLNHLHFNSHREQCIIFVMFFRQNYISV